MILPPGGLCPAGRLAGTRAALCHLAGAHRASASDLKGLGPYFHAGSSLEGRTSGLSLRKGRA